MKEFKRLKVKDNSVSTDITRFLCSMNDDQYTRVETGGRGFIIATGKGFNDERDFFIKVAQRISDLETENARLKKQLKEGK